MDESDKAGEESIESVDSEEEEEEPKLKYEWIRGHLPDILMGDGASCIFVNDKLLILGTNRGKICVFDHQGNKIKNFDVHSDPVIMIDMDASGDYIASCSHDRKVVVQGLYNNELCYNFGLGSPVRCIAIEPIFGKPRSKKKFIVGTHQVVLYEKGLFGAVKPTVLYEGSGGVGQLIRTMRWRGQFMALAMDSGVRVMDMTARNIISLIQRDHSLALGCDQYPPHLCWQDDCTLLIGWGDSVKVCRVRERTSDSAQYSNLDLPPYKVEIVYMFVTDFYICGLGPLDSLVVVLAYNKWKKKKSGEGKGCDEGKPPHPEGEGGATTQPRQEWRRPQMRVLQPLQGTYEELSKDVLAIKGYHDYQPVNYHLEYLSAERSFYIVCPQDVVVAKPREAPDRLKWLLEHDKFQEALHVVQSCGGKVCEFTTLNVGQAFIAHLFHNEEYEQAANLAPSILGRDKLLWEEMVARFHDSGHLNFLSSHIPTGPPGPLLSKAIYQTVLLDLLNTDHETFLQVVQKWCESLYNVSLTINSVLEVLAKNSSNTVLLRALAHLYSNVNKHDKALAIYLKLKHKDLFCLIHRHALYWCVSKHILPLMSLECDEALDMCSKYIALISPQQVAQALEANEAFLYKYLEMLYTRHPDACTGFHNRLIQLYALYDKVKIMPLLLASSNIDLEPALNIVRQHCLIQEMVYLLDRMESSGAALKVVLEEEQDVDWAIRICKEHSDPDLWNTLIKYSIDKPDYIRVLLNSIGSHVDPLLILSRIPSNLQIPGLRDALTKIMHDYQMKITLQNGYQKILVTDGIKLLDKQVSNQRTAIPVRSDSECSSCNKKIIQSQYKDDLEVVVFVCRHIYHSKCLSEQQPDFQICVVCTNSKKINIGT